MYTSLAVLAIFAFVYSVVAGRVERTWISGPIIFVIVGVVVGSRGLGWISLGPTAETLMILAELTLALVLFVDAANADFAVLRDVKQLPVRLLGVGLPLTILLGFGAGLLLFSDLSTLEIALLATMLAPTDAALGKAVVSNEIVPNKVRQGLSVESGLNDGICVPILFLFLMLAEGQAGEGSPLDEGLVLFAEVVGIGAVCGVILAAAAAMLLKACHRLGWIAESWMVITVLALSFACFASAQALGGSGFIASFLGGITFALILRPHHSALLEAGEGLGDLCSMLTWLTFGSVVVSRVTNIFAWNAILYAVLSLTVVRILPVYLCLTGWKASKESKLFIGWFGPRGLASIVFIVIVMEAHLPGNDTLVAVVAWTVIMSVVAHGVTANPWAKAFGRRSGHQTE